jgi:hypothetical protein
VTTTIRGVVTAPGHADPVVPACSTHSGFWSYDFEGGMPAGWTTSTGPAWYADTARAHGGTRSIRGADIGDNQQTGVQFTVTLADAGTLSFWYTVSSESGFDYLRAYDNGTQLGRWSGNVGWTQVSFALAAGTHTIEFRYTKDGSVSSGSDTGWVDDVQITTASSCTGAGCTWTQACSSLLSSAACGAAAGCSWSGSACTGTMANHCTGTPTPIPNPWGAPDPLYDVQVYVPGTTPAAFTPGVSCDRCTATPSGNPIAQARTDIDGNFTLTNVPCGTNIPLVIQLGRWRRQITIPSVACCGTTTLTQEQVRMPRNRTEGDIPLIAMVTGDVDVMECILRKIGIDDSEFSNPAAQGGSGRVRFYQDYDPSNGYNGAEYNASTPPDDQLVGAGGDLNQYDMAFFACPGYAYDQSQADQQRLINYANAGGRIFTTHFHYDWLNNNPFAANPAAPTTMAAWSSAAPAPFSQTANWAVNTSSRAGTTAIIDTSFARGASLAQWLFNRGASTTYGQIPVSTIRQDFSSVVAPAQRWLYDSTQPIHYTFDTPITYPPLAATSAANQCGRVVFSDWHAAPSGGVTNWDFPTECSVGPMTPQERVLEFMLFDLASCIPVPTAPACVPQTCASQGLSCGLAADGCGNTLNCGPCPAGTSCGGGGTPGVCGAPTTCVPLTCSSPAAACGVSADGCGGSISCPCTSFAPSGTFTELYASQPAPCTITECPVWGAFNFTADVPAGTRIVFSFQSADTATGFPSAPTATYTVNPPAVGTTVSGSIDVAALMMAAGAPTGRYFLQVTTTLYSDASRTRAPTLVSDNLAFTCSPCG